ncbi:MAG TPA: hypothetical protein VFE05_10185 [Longimicrobiaceae bacterium]|jgi:hypothetical protein|nr:hypothetical protein [Longimicrobiaceae bacterium]
MTLSEEGQMATHDLRLEAELFGSIFSLEVTVEGEKVDLHAENGKLVKNLPNFPVTNPLTLFLRAKGINGAECRVDVFSDDHALAPPLACTIKNGVAQVLQDYHV